MKKIIYIISLINLFGSLLLSSQPNDTDHLFALRRLIDKNIGYDSSIPPDSVIVWGQQISPMLERDNQIELYFQLKLWMVHLYSLNGDIGPAIDEARQMYEKAEAMNYDLGIALSSAAIGDAYYCSNMPANAIESYREAISYPVSSSINNDYKDMFMLRLISFLIEEGQMEEATFYRFKLSKSETIRNNKALQLFSLTNDVNYYIRINELTKACESFEKADRKSVV